MNTKNTGFTLLELIVSLSVGAIVIATSVGIAGRIFKWQKQLEIAQNFHTESRFLMERISQLTRDFSIDYDRYFEEIGPSSGAGFCNTGFEKDQLPIEIYDEIVNGDIDLSDGDPIPNVNTSTKPYRTMIGYENIFAWNTDSTEGPDENLGGQQKGSYSADGDPCAPALNYDDLGTFQYTLDGNTVDGVPLFLINEERTIRKAIYFGEDIISLETMLGNDSDDDGKADSWSGESTWDSNTSTCSIAAGIVMGDSSNEEFCLQAHLPTTITPPIIKVTAASFIPSPAYDPYLAFAIDAAQVHPNVFLALEMELLEPAVYGIDVADTPKTYLQTSISSRIYGNTR